MDWKEYCKQDKWHPAADVFPLLSPPQLEALAKDIKSNGLQNPILLFENKVLDGRNRLLACAKADVRPRFKDWTPNGTTPFEFVVSQNIARRHLTDDQRAALAAKLMPKLIEAARERQKAAGKQHGAKGGRGRKVEKPSAQSGAKGLGKSSVQAAQIIGGVSVRTVEAARNLEKIIPGVLDQIIAGQTTIKKAKSEASQRMQELIARGEQPVSDDEWRDTAVAFGGIKDSLSHRYGAPPFSVLNTKQHRTVLTSVFDPVLCELSYRWFCPAGGRILDPFAGGSTRGIMAACLGYEYIGIELRREQIAANTRQLDAARRNSQELFPGRWREPRWIEGDSSRLSELLTSEDPFDMLFTCPPYYNLEIYSTLKADGSTLKTYDDFMRWYANVFRQAVEKLKHNRFAVIVVGDIRDNKSPLGEYLNFEVDTISVFRNLGLYYYNRAVLHTPAGSLPIRIGTQFGLYRKLGNTHQLAYTFWKGDRDKNAIPEALGLRRERQAQRENDKTEGSQHVDAVDFEPDLFFSAFAALYEKLSVKPFPRLLGRPESPLLPDMEQLICRVYKECGEGEPNAIVPVEAPYVFNTQKTKTAVVLFSGGKDSVAEALKLREAGFEPILFHVHGINKSYSHEAEYCKRLADRLRMPLETRSVRIAGKKSDAFAESPVKNFLILAIAADEFGIGRGICNYASGSDAHLGASVNPQFNLSDAHELYALADKFFAEYLPGFNTHLGIQSSTEAFYTIHKYAPDILRDFCYTSCMTPVYRKPMVRKANLKKGIELEASRCGSCAKCAKEYLHAVIFGVRPFNREYAQRCIESIRKHDYQENTQPQDMPFLDYKAIDDVEFLRMHVPAWADYEIGREPFLAALERRGPHHS